jgi:hypothetical protein
VFPEAGGVLGKARLHSVQLHRDTLGSRAEALSVGGAFLERREHLLQLVLEVAGRAVAQVVREFGNRPQLPLEGSHGRLLFFD